MTITITKRIALAVGTALVLAGFIGGVVWGEGQRRYLHAQAWKAEQVHAYLAAPIAKGTDGQPINRAAVLDALIADVLKRAQAPKQ